MSHDELRCRTAWISDIHLGARSCRAAALLGFLDSLRADHLYLVGDIIDLWKMRSGLFWPQSHHEVLKRIMALPRQGTQVTFIAGNHDGLLRALAKNVIGGIKIRRRAIHTLADGRRFLVFHGDELDFVVRRSRWAGFLGDVAYDILLGLDLVFDQVRRSLGLGYWSLASALKTRSINVAQAIQAFEQAAVGRARRKSLDGVICGHIHLPALKVIDGITYGNDGDWVESCTALVEDFSGKLALMRWPGRADASRRSHASRAAHMLIECRATPDPGQCSAST